jgi:hypothetical protein
MKSFEGGNMKLIASLFLCCALMLAFAGCAKKPVTPGAPAAPQTALDKLSASAYEIANSLDSGEKEFEVLYTSNIPGVSDDGYARTVAKIFLSAQACTKSYIGQLQSVTAVDASNKAQVAGWSNALLSCVNALVNEGVAGIKNADARQRIQNLLAPIPGAIKTIVNALGLPVASAARPCDGAGASLNFTEVNHGPEHRSTAHRAGNSDGREPDRMDYPAQGRDRAYQCGLARRGSQDQRRGRYQDTSVPRPPRGRRLINPRREAWLYT